MRSAISSIAGFMPLVVAAGAGAASRQALGTAVPEVVQGRDPADRARVRVVGHARQVDPVKPVRAHHDGIAVVDLREELARSIRWLETPDAGSQRRIHYLQYHLRQK